MGIKEAFGAIPEAIRKLGVKVHDDFGEFVKLNSPEREGLYFFGILQEMPKEEKPKGFKKSAIVAQFTELEPMTGEVLGLIKLLLTADLKSKLAKCKKGDTLCIYQEGQKDVKKGNPMLVYSVIKLHSDFTGLASIGIESPKV
jgi:hypothetical protein